MKDRGLLLARLLERGAFSGVAIVGAFVLIAVTWLWDASILTAAADENLRLLRAATHILPHGWGSKLESTLRLLAADRALLLTESIVGVKAVMRDVTYSFRRPIL